MSGGVFPPCYLPGPKRWWRWCRKWWPPSKGPMYALLPQCPQPCSRPPPTHASAGDPWTLLGRSGSVSCGSLLLSPGSWCIWGSVCVFQESNSQSCFSFGSSIVGLTATSSKRAYAIPKSAAPRAPAPAAGHCWPVLHSRHSNTVLSQSLWGLWVHSWLISVKKENMLYKGHPATFGNLAAFLKVLVVYPTCVAM